jgi:hypothetical protein
MCANQLGNHAWKIKGNMLVLQPGSERSGNDNVNVHGSMADGDKGRLAEPYSSDTIQAHQYLIRPKVETKEIGNSIKLYREI